MKCNSWQRPWLQQVTIADDFRIRNILGRALLMWFRGKQNYHQTSNISCTSDVNKIVPRAPFLIDRTPSEWIPVGIYHNEATLVTDILAHEMPHDFTSSSQSFHYNDVIMGVIASQITSLTSVYSTVCSGVDQRKHQSSASLAFVWGIHRGPENSPHKWPVTRKIFPFDDVIM